MNEPAAKASVTCRDGKVRSFVAQVDGECLHFQGKKNTYVIWDEAEGRGFFTMMPCWNKDNERIFVLAPSKFQPVKIEAETWAGKWRWESECG